MADLKTPGRQPEASGQAETGGPTETVLVSGGSGFLGGWCLVELLRRGYRVRTTVRDAAKEPELRARLASVVEHSDDRLSVHVADLESDDHWAKAIEGCEYVLHVASPFPPKQPKDPDELIVPAREGTLRVLGAALDAGVRRVVVTSSVAAVRGSASESEPAKPLDESEWTDGDNPKLVPYVRSKALAERAAWDLVDKRGERDRLATINPGAILGPVLGEERSFSLQMVERLLKGVPGAPRIGFSVVDVRDVADLHLRAMTAPEAGGERFIAATRFMWMAEVAAVLRERLGPDAARVPKRQAPDFAVRVMGIFDPSVRVMTSQLGKRLDLSSEKAQSLLGWSPRPVEETVADCAESLLDSTAA
ncbi:MAG TPA: NAD-dependent epimerase/dehydratase family protein [Solirubrobacterales bacterium]|nr:NAD-dependent epimerase/dehydratase family protein [Solirubrobacterales bacterium]